MRVFGRGFLALVLASLPSVVLAERLSEKGAFLGTVSVAAGTARLAHTVDLGGDKPTATHVIARFRNNQPLQRTTEGYWIPWNDSVDALIDNHFQPAGDRLTFKIVAEDLSGTFFPVSFILMYRVGGALKFGELQVVPK